MKTTWLISDTHWNHDKIATYCDRPADFTERIIRNCQQIIKPEDLVIHCGDVAIGNRRRVRDIMSDLPGRWVLVRGNHDRQHGNDWWMDQGFAFSCDAMKYRGCWITHEPAKDLPEGCSLNIHGHLHNIWHGFKPEGQEAPTKLRNPWQWLFAVEYTDYRPVSFDKFVAHPDKYHARGIIEK